ncbi:MAG TPA: hypothetical protein VHA56_22115 [Mucilaginibacter sp.]|nr:hypothetical protein [Mucilaginibacter sp.]
MKTLNQHSTLIFCQLLDRLNGRQHLKIENEPFMPLTMEKTGEAYGGEAVLYSLCHYYKQNGDLMQDPEMGFVVVDGRTADNQNPEHVQVTPCFFQQANMGIYQQSITFLNGMLQNCDDTLQHEHAAFADLWLSNIEAQGFLRREV